MRYRPAAAGSTARIAFNDSATGFDTNIVVNETVISSGNLNIGDTAVSNANAAQASTGNELDGFTMFMSTGSGSVNTIAVTGNANFNATNIPTNGVKIYRDAGTIGVLDGADTLISSGSTAIASNATTVTLTSAESVTTATGNYLVVVDLNAGAGVGNTITGTVSGASGTGLGTLADNDTASATLTVTAGAGLTVATGTNPANANASRGSTNNALNGFSMVTTTGAATINTLTFSGGGNFSTTNVVNPNGVKVYHDNGTPGVLDGADTLIPTTSSITGAVATITFTTPEAVNTTLQNYLVVVDIPAAATVGNTLTGTVTAATGSGYLTSAFTDSSSATLTITAAQTLTVNNGTNPANANVNIGGTGSLDAFTLALSTGTGSINTLTLTGSVNFTTTNIASATVVADNGVIGTYEPGTDTAIATSYSQVGTVGTITFTTPEPVTTTAKNYLVRVTTTAGATVSQQFTGTITAATGSGLGTPTYSDLSSATLTIASGPVATIGTCGGCHFYTGITGNLPQDGTARNVPIGQFPGSHAVHANTYAYACSVCHRVPATTTTVDNDHSNGRIRMTNPINGNLNAKYGNVTSWTVSNSASIVYNRCTTTICHGQRSPVWGTVGNVNSCLTCHGQLAGTFVNFSAANIAPGGAGQDTGGNTATTFPRVGTHQNHLLAQSKMSPPVHCGECHSVHTTVTDGTHLNYTTATISFGPTARKNTNFAPNATRVSGVINCNNVYCHLGGFRPAGTAAGQRGNITTTWAFNGTSILDNATVAGTCTNKCHGMPPGGSVATGDTHSGIATPTTVAGLSACSSATGGTGCHPTLKIRAGVTNFTNLTSVFFAQGSQHIDGAVQGGSCTGCHSAVKGARVAVANQFTGTNYSHHYQGTAPVDGKVCYACHWEATSTGDMNATYHTGSAAGVVDLVVWGTSTTRPTNYATNSVTYLSGGASASSRTELAKINNHCLGCHNDTNKTTATFVGDTATPSKYSWEALLPAAGGFGAAQSIDVKYSSTTTTLWGKFAGNYTNAKNSQIKAFSAHGNATVNQRGWSTIEENPQGAAVANYPNTSGSANNVLCFDCHNSHGSEASVPANAVTSSYSSATGRGRGAILKTTVAGQGGYTVSYRPYTGGNAAQKNSFKTGAGLCFDCHNNATVGLPTSTGYTTPWGYGTAGTFGGSAKIHGYNDNPYFGKTGGTFARGITYPYIGTGVGTNKGGHFGASSALTNATTFKIGGLCTPCHDPHGVSPGIAAANQQYAVPMLKETFATSPYKMDAAPPSVTTLVGGGRGQAVISLGSVAGYHIDQNTMQTAATGKPATALKWAFATSATTLQTLNDTQFAGLCLKCHSKANLNNTVAATSATGTDGSWKAPKRIHNAVKGWALTTGSGGNVNNKVHAYTCSKCHSTHNSNLPRLLVTNCLDVKHRGRVASTGVPGSNTGSGTSGSGAGRFPGGGGGSVNRGSSTNPGPWFFGTTGNPGATQLCHDSATAGGTTFNATSQLWNTKSPW